MPFYIEYKTNLYWYTTLIVRHFHHRNRTSHCKSDPLKGIDQIDIDDLRKSVVDTDYRILGNLSRITFSYILLKRNDVSLPIIS